MDICKYLIFLVFLTSCASSVEPIASEEPQIIVREKEVVVSENDIIGTSNELWSEEMIDTVKVPGQVDPSDTYYRLPHKTIYRIRPGKVQIIEDEK